MSYSVPDDGLGIHEMVVTERANTLSGKRISRHWTFTVSDLILSEDGDDNE